jgi:hypothetical protein
MALFDDDPIDPGRDAVESAPAWLKEKRNWLRILRESDSELDPDSSFYEPDAVVADLYFQGGPGPRRLLGHKGVALMIPFVAPSYQVYSVKPNGRWLKKLAELPEQPAGTRWDAGKRGYFTPDGHVVSKLYYVNALRRGDPTPYTIRFSGPETRTVDDWANRDQRLAGPGGAVLPLWGAFWRWRAEEVEGDAGETYLNWAVDPRPLGRFGDGSPEAPTDAEYRLARTFARAAATALGAAKAAAGAHAAAGSAHAADEPPPPTPDAYGSESELPDYLRR